MDYGQRDDVSRVLVEGVHCGVGYTARHWPDGEIQLIGKEGCSCGETDIRTIDDLVDDGSPSGANAE
nr:hypothetical protein [Halopiger aswanensis]